MALSRIPPEQFGKAVFAAADALHHVGAWQPAQHEHVAPGVRGVTDCCTTKRCGTR